MTYKTPQELLEITPIGNYASWIGKNFRRWRSFEKRSSSCGDSYHESQFRIYGCVVHNALHDTPMKIMQRIWGTTNVPDVLVAVASAHTLVPGFRSTTYATELLPVKMFLLFAAIMHRCCEGSACRRVLVNPSEHLSVPKKKKKIAADDTSPNPTPSLPPVWQNWRPGSRQPYYRSAVSVSTDLNSLPHVSLVRDDRTLLSYGYLPKQHF
ncbi:hypothetical protein NPIL_631771 [Nephila pilipes]|uniref:Uncharacterized protein n=1 Tax=Nephila pilipes TaxID=299642 RepID=A0A8X6TYY3_NEPPI|nr:hypothetical protein NPIL_631771 [Nephila pilipes]